MNRALILLLAVALVLLTATGAGCIRWELARAILVDLPGLSKRRLAIMFPSIACTPDCFERGPDDRDPVDREPRF